MPTIAVLTAGRLTGLKELKKPKKGDIVVDDGIDLPLDGSYKWDRGAKCFVPLGHGFGRPKPCPVPDTLVLYRMAKAMDSPPQDVLDWCSWYEGNLLERHQEAVQSNDTGRK